MVCYNDLWTYPEFKLTLLYMVVQLILDGREPNTITLNKLRKGFPEDWEEQRHYFGIE